MTPEIFWINLEKDTDRRADMESALKDRFPNTRIEGIWNQDGRAGCCLSHIKAIRTAWKSGANQVLICEDDVDFTANPDWHRHLQDILRSAPVLYGDWEVLQLHWVDPKFMGELIVSNIQQNVLLRGYLMSGAMYLINRRGMERFLSLFTRENANANGTTANTIESDYTVLATFDHPKCTPEELIYRYVNTYCSLFPIVNVNERGKTNVARDPQQWVNNFTNMHLVTALFASNTSLKYSVAAGRVYELAYDMHWHSDPADARTEISNIAQMNPG